MKSSTTPATYCRKHVQCAALHINTIWSALANWQHRQAKSQWVVAQRLLSALTMPSIKQVIHTRFITSAIRNSQECTHPCCTVSRQAPNLTLILSRGL